jgi:hypothetical protein
MSDRRELQAQKNKLAEMYQTQRVKMENAGASVDQLSRLKKMFNDKVANLEQQYGDTLSKLNRGENVRISGGSSSGVELNQSKLPDMSKKVGLGKESLLKRLGKKAGIIPLAGTAYGLMSGDPAMAAEQAASDVVDLAGPAAARLGAGAAAGPIGLAALAAQQALSPSEAGSAEEENMMLAEIEARKRYAKSAAFSDLRKKLRKKAGK